MINSKIVTAPSWLLIVIVLVGFLLQASGQSGERSAALRSSFRSDVNEVVVRAAVTDRLNRAVGHLKRENFKIFENKVEQTISHFSKDNGPLSVGIILDTSGSMARGFSGAKASALRFLDQRNEQDEFFLVTFADRPVLAHDFTKKTENIRNQVALVKATGSTAFYDAVYIGLQKLKEAHNDRKVLIVITDGDDNNSRYGFSNLKEFARESDALIYVIAQNPRKLPTIDYCHRVIKQLVDVTGGRAFFTNYFNEIEDDFDLIEMELRNQYVLGYVPSNPIKDGKWRRIQVQLERPEKTERLLVRCREGYFAPRG
jgi:Ca-activated chloride channel family protein